MEKVKFKVCVSCMTYNQSEYITDTMNGFCMQETRFPFVCIIVDDASTDGEQDVIRKYLLKNFDIRLNDESFEKETDYAHISFARHLKNHNCYFVVIYLKENHFASKRSKYQYLREWRDNVPYIACCDGDDYWIDSLKLQKQYSLMESHQEFSLCHHDYMVLNGVELRRRNVKIPPHQDIISLAVDNRIATPTMFYRNISEPLVPAKFPFKHRVYQHFYNLRLAEFGEIVYIDEPMSVYRVNQGGIYSMKSTREKFSMAMGNLENMIDWYTSGKPKPRVVAILKKRARIIGMSFIMDSIKHLNLKDIYFMWKWIYKLQGK